MWGCAYRAVGGAHLLKQAGKWPQVPSWRPDPLERETWVFIRLNGALNHRFRLSAGPEWRFPPRAEHRDRRALLPEGLSGVTTGLDVPA